MDEAADEDSINNDAEFFRLYDTRYLRRETKDYVPKLIAAALIAKEPTKYGFPPPPHGARPSRTTRSWCPRRPGST